MAKTNHTRAPERLFLEDKAYQRFRDTAVGPHCGLGPCGYANDEQFRRAAWYSMHPTLEETGRRSA
jgi:hypothetical protein